MTHNLTPKETIASWFAQILAATIMLQTLFFKFTGAEESVYIFSTLGIEPWGRYLIGVGELIASILLLIPRLCWLGASIGTGIISGAILSHLTILGISVKNDGGYLFILGLITFSMCILVLYLRKKQIPFFKTFFPNR